VSLEDRLSFRRLSIGGAAYFLGIVHFFDKRNWDIFGQAGQSQLLAESVRRLEKKHKCERTILIGDFNMNPFDPGMVSVTGLNAMMTKTCIENGTRVLQGVKYPFFYNPMWNHFGDETAGPSGTFYHRSSSQGFYGWNMLDQVLLRQSAIPVFQRVEIVSRVESKSLASAKGRPSASIASDHLPLLLCLK
jgi:hypothetical protein